MNSLLPNSDGAPSSGSKEAFVKFLLSGSQTGAVIGRRGATIAELHSRTGASLRISAVGKFFPQTRSRVALLAGTLSQVQSALCELVVLLAAQATEVGAPQSADERAVVMRLVVPNSAASSLIGVGGRTIRALQETTGARIQLGRRVANIRQRVLSISGCEAAVRDAAWCVTTELQANPHLAQHLALDYQQRGTMRSKGGNLRIAFDEAYRVGMTTHRLIEDPPEKDGKTRSVSVESGLMASNDNTRLDCCENPPSSTSSCRASLQAEPPAMMRINCDSSSHRHMAFLPQHRHMAFLPQVFAHGQHRSYGLAVVNAVAAVAGSGSTLAHPCVLPVCNPAPVTAVDATAAWPATIVTAAAVAPTAYPRRY